MAKFSNSDLIPDIMYFNPIEDHPGEWQMTPIKGPHSVVFYKKTYADELIEEQRQKYNSVIELKEKISHILSDAGKIRMRAYNQAKEWNQAVSKKFDAMIAAAKEGNIFDRLIGWRIWAKCKRDWDAQRIRKQY